MRRFAQSLVFVAAAALVGGVGCCNNSKGSNGTASNGTAGTASNGGATNGGTAGNGTASNGGNAGNGTASNGGNAGNGTASNGGNAGNGTASNGGNAGNGTASNGGASNGASNGGSNGGASCTDASTCTSGFCIAGACTNPDCNVPELVTTNLELTSTCLTWYIGQPGTVVQAASLTGPGPVLTVDPGETVAVAPGAFLDVGVQGPGTLQVNGTAAKPVAFTASGAQTAGAWVGIALGDYAVGSALSSTTISYASGGTLSTAIYPGALVVFGGANTNLVALNDVTVQHNAGNGFVFAGHGAGLTAASGNLTVSDWATGSYPFVMDANELGSLPTTLTLGANSGPPALALDCQDTTGCGNPMTVDHTQTWPALPMTVVILNELGAGTAPGINVEGATGVATLTIDGPNTFEFVDGSRFLVDNLILGQGELVANGTLQDPITFESIDANPGYGAWQGFDFTAATSNSLQGSSMSYCDIADATGFTVATENGLVSGAITIDASSAVTAADGGVAWPSITNCTFTNYGSCGVFTQDVSTPSEYGTPTSAAGGNVFEPAPGPADAGQTSDVCTL